MTIKECYDAMGADYQNTLNRFPNEAFIKKFVLKFLDDNNLYKASSAITEIFRAGELAGAKEAFEEVEKQYNITVNAIKAM